MIVVTDDLQVIEGNGCLTGRQVIAAVIFAGDDGAFDCVVRPRLTGYAEKHELAQCLQDALRKYLDSRPA